MKKLHFLLFFYFTCPLSYGMEPAIEEPFYITPILPDIIPALSCYLDLSSISSLLRTCTTYSDKYNKGIPTHIAQGIAHNYDCITPEQFNQIPFGMDRFLLQNSDYCATLSPHEQINALVRYAQKDNRAMFKHMVDNENSSNAIIRHNILVFFEYSDAKNNLSNSISAYLGNKNNKEELTYSDLCTSDIHVARILILNKKYELCNEKPGWVALHYLAKLGLSTNLIPLALAITPDINRKTGKGRTALHLAIKNNHRDMYVDLILLGADINSEDTRDQTPLCYTVKFTNNSDFLTLLITNGADVNCENKKSLRVPLHSAALLYKYNMVKLLLEHAAPVNSTDLWDNTPLHLAARNGYNDIAQLLLENGANANSKDNTGETPLHDAARHRRIDTVRLLIKYGADINAINNKGQLPLYFAIKYNDIGITQLLTDKNNSRQPFKKCIIS